MDSFEFFFSFYGLLLGFSVATVSVGIVSIVALRGEVRITPLPILLGVFLLQDIATLWVFAWFARESLTVNYANIYGAMIVATLYFMAASLAFPLGLNEQSDPEAHYWKNKHLVLGAIAAGSALTTLHGLAVDAINLASPLTWILQAIYWTPLLALIFTRSKAADLSLLSLLVVGYLAEPIMDVL
jgi:hypothetical protein